ncbi:alpha/beta hydrolase fold protein [Desulfobulbus propionicus DSM 2032]|uniref:Alpha/beta hydrolase fold protein n=1 Tax=Desulfobulbus propionicus (strain ATCC 33891 / DSM 2032 / VKM B-1956 / 1pr3) TaxID=577650 RepID=A0A7U3YJS7_DESPD|nr:alpha/beta fold hydrolase [Desulfobulbus propionicus]ADW16678.1 alpha/beta hydrolase fold protein [Desulfobulbus propionicus DSM 2032]
MTANAANVFFLHGLDSSIQGTKARWFRDHFPQVGMQDYQGDLGQRLAQLETQLAGRDRLILVGSSFGGLMAACFAQRYPERCRRLVLLAPALNFGDYRPPSTPLTVPAVLVMGDQDNVCPPALVLPQARATFSDLTVWLEHDDHMLHRTFPALDWAALLT